MKVTYNAPPQDDRAVTFMGLEFFAGHAVDVDREEHSELIAKAKHNPHFTVEDDADGEDNDGSGDAGAAPDGGDGSDRQPKRRGRKPREKHVPAPAAGIAE